MFFVGERFADGKLCSCIFRLSIHEATWTNLHGFIALHSISQHDAVKKRVLQKTLTLRLPDHMTLKLRSLMTLSTDNLRLSKPFLIFPKTIFAHRLASDTNCTPKINKVHLYDS